jgi:shikimate kinase
MLVLIGMPGSGKSTIGKQLAEMENLPFIDTDELIIEQTGKPLKELLNCDFKEIETTAVKSIPFDFNGIVATGGSVVYSNEAMQYLKNIGTIIYLQVYYEDLLSRIKNFESRGIVIRPGMTFKDLFNERTPLYKKWADVWLINDSSDVTIQQLKYLISK